MTFGEKKKQKEIGGIDQRTKSTLETIHARFEIGHKSKTKVNNYCSMKNVKKHLKSNKLAQKSTKTAASIKASSEYQIKKGADHNRKSNLGIYQNNKFD